MRRSQVPDAGEGRCAERCVGFKRGPVPGTDDMKLHEYQAKEVFSEAGITTPASELAETVDDARE